MAKLFVKYDRRLRSVLGYRAVWEPGATISLGDVVTRKRGLFTDVARLSDWGVRFRRERRREARLTLNAQGVSETLLQLGAEVAGVSDLKPDIEAELKIRFGQSHSYCLKTTSLSGEDIGDMARVGRRITAIEDWRFRDYWVVWRVLVAKDFTFLGSMGKNREISLAGSGKSIAKFLESGVSGALERSSSRKLDLEIIGSQGPIAIGVTRIRKDGRLRDV